MNRLAVILLVGALMFAPAAFGDTVSLSPCNCADDAPAIQQAIASATQNGTVPGTVVLTGTFSLLESLTIDVPSVTIAAGPSGATIVAPSITAFMLFSGADGFTLSHLTVVTRRGLFTSAALPINNVSILEDTFDTVSRGISQFVANGLSSGWVIRGNTFLATDTSGCSGASGCVAILVTGVAGVIENNSIQYGSLGIGIVVQDNRGSPGVTADGGSGWSVQDNSANADMDIWVNGGSSNQIAGNRLTQAGSYGVVLSPGLPGEVFSGIVVTAEMNKVSDNQLQNKSIAGIAVANGAVGNSLIRNTIIMSAGTGIDVGSDIFPLGLQVGPATDNQIHANLLASGDIGIDLRVNSGDNIVTGNQISTTNAPAQGIVQESTTNGNLVHGNPGFDPITGSGPTIAAPARVLGPGA